jgi:hypothetical protein
MSNETIVSNPRFSRMLLEGLIPTAEERLQRLRALRNLTVLRLEDYCKGRDGCWGYNTRADGSLSYGDLKEEDCPDCAAEYLRALSTDDSASGELYFYLPYASGSDYSGDIVCRSNALSFGESYGSNDWVHTVYGGYSTYAVAIGLTGLLTCADDTADSILDALEGLDDYPVLDEEALSALESEESDSAWESWVAGDFGKALEAKFADVADLDVPAGEALRTFFEDKCESANVYWYNEGSGHDMYVKVDDVVAGIEFADVAGWAFCYVVSWVDVGNEEEEEYNVESDAIERVAQLRATGFAGATYRTVNPVNASK